MKVVILAGGFGTRISELSNQIPKPMIEIGGRPILWHIMKIYSSFGFNDFVICLGYKGYCIKEYFAHYYLHESDMTFDFGNENERMVHHHSAEPWRVTLIDTGSETMTVGRVKRAQKYLGDEPFLLTYGDGVSDVNIASLVAYHKAHGKLVTVTSTQPTGRFGSLELDSANRIQRFQEKSKEGGAWVNCGFFVIEPMAINYIFDDATVLEKEPMEDLARDSQLVAFKHQGFWQPMDTMRDKNNLEDLWNSGKAPWKLW